VINVDHTGVSHSAYLQAIRTKTSLKAVASNDRKAFKTIKQRSRLMLIEVRTDGNIEGSEQLSDHVKAVVHAALDRFGDHVRRIDVHLSDEIGNKIGHDDKCCMIEARRDGREPIVVTHRETTMDQAIHRAVHSLKISIESAIGKESGSAHIRSRH
jgi:hypothetical protein